MPFLYAQSQNESYLIDPFSVIKLSEKEKENKVIKQHLKSMLCISWTFNNQSRNGAKVNATI